MDKICVIGLGYVGLPLAIEFSKKYETYGLDISKSRIESLKKGHDATREVDNQTLLNSKLKLTSELADVKDCNIYIVTVPTPITRSKEPDLGPLLAATKSVATVLKKNDIVIYESTVYPGCTEEDCVPILERDSGLLFNQDFFCGYSPERMNPGDKDRTLTKIIKVTSGSTPAIAEKVDTLYSSIIPAGTHRASSIKVAEAAKIIENTQRDINIAFVNELSIIFNKLEINTYEVLEAAATKWNFLKFKPGLVGGHCIGVDPYYLTRKAELIGHHPEIILAGRRINDSMGQYAATQVIKILIKNDLPVKNAKAVVLGFTFKENCPDIRNTKVVDLISELQSFGVNPSIIDPWASKEEVCREYNLTLAPTDDMNNLDKFDVIILAVAHKEFLNIDFERFRNEKIIYDLKGILPKSLISGSF